MSRALGQSRMQVSIPTPDCATSGWLVEIDLADPGKAPDRRYFAVGLADADEAVEAVLGYPGMLRKDRRLAIRLLSRDEISRLRLRPQAVRPYAEAMREWVVNHMP
jgi:hypothetical protein